MTSRITDDGTDKTSAPALPVPASNAAPEPYQKHFKGKGASKFVDPCAEASKASMNCMNLHDYDREQCLDYFQAYRDCKKAWMEQRKADRRAGKAVD
ncbi:uncharacterized protein BXZ73DRAFT_100411 [Epithele typhae]|uniref:uncharacterized protein n=1 Tax=Epithele typhae TaxID=378194 RepID=UPI002008B6BD|nr:uncharacterized protein BXZ73DRAFT_100411 [Epithele typhae]KAH9935939.1 hypothetical protein BXZ73DRAFT_100411 [Epithele typhae]